MISIRGPDYRFLKAMNDKDDKELTEIIINTRANNVSAIESCWGKKKPCIVLDVRSNNANPAVPIAFSVKGAKAWNGLPNGNVIFEVPQSQQDTDQTGSESGSSLGL